MKHITLICNILVILVVALAVSNESSFYSSYTIYSTPNPQLQTVTGVVEYFDNIFVGVVEKETMTLQPTDISDPFPYTFYSVKTIFDLKGVTKNYITIEFYGGYTNLGDKVILENSEMPIVGQVYLFFVNHSRYNLDEEISRTSGDVYPVTTPVSILLLSDYDINQSIFEQNSHIQSVFTKYQSIIDKNT